jgi:hypothetical protein
MIMSIPLADMTGGYHLPFVLAAGFRNVLLEHQSQIARECRAVRIDRENAPKTTIRTKEPLLQHRARE